MQNPCIHGTYHRFHCEGFRRVSNDIKLCSHLLDSRVSLSAQGFIISRITACRNNLTCRVARKQSISDPNTSQVAMASVIWTSVFVFLCIELVIVFVLVLPLPKQIRAFMAKQIRRFKFGARVRTTVQCESLRIDATILLIPGITYVDRIGSDVVVFLLLFSTSVGIIFVLIAALMESISTVRRLKSRDSREQSGRSSGDMFGDRTNYVEASMEKQRIFRAERNLYLAGFALTLLFVIQRVVELISEGVRTAEERDAAKQRLDDFAGVEAPSDMPSASANSSLRQRTAANSKSD
jgi:Bap31/Bap29 transmembrane region